MTRLACEGRHEVRHSAELCHAACVLQPAVCHAEVITQPPETADTLYLECQNNEELSRHKMQHFSQIVYLAGGLRSK